MNIVWKHPKMGWTQAGEQLGSSRPMALAKGIFIVNQINKKAAGCWRVRKCAWAEQSGVSWDWWEKGRRRRYTYTTHNTHPVTTTNHQSLLVFLLAHHLCLFTCSQSYLSTNITYMTIYPSPPRTLLQALLCHHIMRVVLIMMKQKEEKKK